MWKSIVNSLAQVRKKETAGEGCIVAHCMGLGKTLSV